MRLMDEMRGIIQLVNACAVIASFCQPPSIPASQGLFQESLGGRFCPEEPVRKRGGSREHSRQEALLSGRVRAGTALRGDEQDSPGEFRSGQITIHPKGCFPTEWSGRMDQASPLWEGFLTTWM